MFTRKKIVIALSLISIIIIVSLVFGLPIGYYYCPGEVGATQAHRTDTEYFWTALSGYYGWEFDAEAETYGAAGGSGCLTVQDLDTEDTWGTGCVFTNDEPYFREGFHTMDKTHSFKIWVTISDSTGAANWFNEATGFQQSVCKKDSK